MTTHEIQTGELRSLLQPVVHVRLTVDVPPLQAGDVVGAQYWGQGRVTLTRVRDGARAVNVAHQVKAESLDPTQLVVILGVESADLPTIHGAYDPPARDHATGLMTQGYTSEL